MRKRITSLFWVIVLVLLVVLIFSSLPFSDQIDQQISANIYQDGIVSGTTTILMNGEKTNYLFEENFYNGIFDIPMVEQTGREGMRAYISWDDPSNIKRMIYSSSGVFYEDLICSTIMINDDMTQFALTLKNGTVLATSEEVYQIYTDHVFYNLNTGVTSVTGSIPFF